MNHHLNIKDLRYLEKLNQKYEKMLEIISFSNEDPYFVDIHKYLDGGGTTPGYFIENDLKMLKHFMSYKNSSVPKIWKEIKMIENLPEEIIQLILSFVDPLSLRYFSSDVISKQFKWVRSDENMIKDALKKTDFNLVDSYSFSRFLPHFDTSLFQTYSRIIPYSRNYSNELNLYENLYLFQGES
jgi:hypothetical protein